jgi:hypothetical protein
LKLVPSSSLTAQFPLLKSCCRYSLLKKDHKVFLKASDSSSGLKILSDPARTVAAVCRDPDLSRMDGVVKITVDALHGAQVNVRNRVEKPDVPVK